MTTAVSKPLSVKEVAERLGVSRALVYALVDAGRIRHERHGIGRGVIRITEEALAEYRKTSSVEPVGEQPIAAPPPARVRLKRLGI